MDKQSRILSLLQNAFGSYRKTGKSNYAFHCPNCNHRKNKLEVNVDTGNYHCWVCDNDVKGRSIFSLLKRFNVAQSYFDELGRIDNSYIKTFTKVNDPSIDLVTLPIDFIPLWKFSKDPEYRNAIKYLKKRNITASDIIRYNIGYCISGKYKQKLIIPSYDESNSLNYFVVKDYYIGSYLNPPHSKNVVIFDSYINWNVPVILVEGMFDAIAIKFNALPLLGKQLNNSIKNKLKEKRVKQVYLILDSDALTKSLQIADYLIKNGILVNLVTLPEGEDPSSLGFMKMNSLIEKSVPLTFKSLMKIKLGSI